MPAALKDLFVFPDVYLYKLSLHIYFYFLMGSCCVLQFDRMLATLILPCLMRDTILVEVVVELARAPLYTAECFTGSKGLPACNPNELSGDNDHLYSYYCL